MKSLSESQPEFLTITEKKTHFQHLYEEEQTEKRHNKLSYRLVSKALMSLFLL